MKVVLLCAGYGTRLYPLTKNQPKPLLPLAGKPILEHLLERLEGVRQVEEAFVITNDRFAPHFQEWVRTKHYRFKVQIVNDGTQTNETRLGAIGDLNFAVKKHGIRDDLSVLAGDNLFFCDLNPFFDFAESRRPHPSLAIIDVEDRALAKQYGIVQTNAKGCITQFLEKPANPPSTLASTGIYWFPKEGLNLLDRYVAEGHNADRLGDYISWMVKNNSVYAYPLEGKWFDIGDLNSYREADQLLQKNT